MARKLEARRGDILAAAIGLLAAGGMDALTTTALADAAHCSKKTIYALFPDKGGLLAAIVQTQAETVAKELESGLGSMPRTKADAREASIRLGVALLDLLLSPASIAINRAAASDASGQLGGILRSNGRDRFVPGISSLLKHALGQQKATEAQVRTDANELFLLFYGLLFADRQVAAILGANVPPMNEKARLDEASRAFERLEAICAAT